jgi:hypothetical protein
MEIVRRSLIADQKPSLTTHSQWLPPNFGSRRDIPAGVVFHPSVHRLYEYGLLDEMPEPRVEDTSNWLWKFLRFCLAREVKAPMKDKKCPPPKQSTQDGAIQTAE